MGGEDDRWATWLDRHAAPLLLLARQYVPDQAEAEDVLQEAFVRFWKVRDRVADPAAFLYASIKGVALDGRRAGSRRLRREQVTARGESVPWLAAGAEDGERRAAVEAALKGLPEAQREVLVLRVWGGLSFEQTAAALGVSENTAKSRYRYALLKLGGWLSQEALL